MRGIDVARAHDVRGGRERAVDVAAGLLEAQQRLGRRARVDDRVERLVVDLDELGGVLGLARATAASTSATGWPA